MEVGSVLDRVLDVFSGVSSWLTEAIQSLIPIFYTQEDGLTVLGVLCIAGLAISVAFLLLGMLQRFFNFRAN